MPSVSRILIASITLPFDGNDNEKKGLIHNHPAWLAGLGIESKVFVGIADHTQVPSDTVPVKVDPKDRLLHQAFCKERLWPLLHYSIWDKPLLDVQLEGSMYRGFETINQQFCKTILEEFRDGDQVIIIGYHLALLPALLKQCKPHLPIILFLKCPVSSSEYLKCLPQAKQVVRGTLGADLVVVQSDSFARHCASFCLRILNFEREDLGGGNVRIVDNNGEVQVEMVTRWLGVDVERAREMQSSYGVMEKVNELRRLFDTDTKVILGIDGVDQLRGVKHKLEVYKLLLETSPDFIGKVPL